jgi:SAM-dependent methyltransferase
MGRRPLRLLPRDTLVKTNDLDQGDWTYRRVVGRIMRLRFRAVVRALVERPPVGRLLEVGYGGGLFLPELRTWCRQLHGLDVHPFAPAVERCLAEQGVDAHLLSADVTAMPYAAGAFDAVVVVSALEFVPDLDLAGRELVRVLAPGGALVVVTPGSSRLLDLGLRLLTRERAEDTFEGRRVLVVPALERVARVVDDRRLPPVVGRLLHLYRALVLERR